MVNVKMKKYIILFNSIAGMGGGQMYVRNKLIFMREKGWDAYIVSWFGDKILIPEFECYKELTFKEMTLTPMTLENKEVDYYIEKIIKMTNIKEKDEVIVESNTPVMAYWGEILAKKIAAKHIVYLLDERNDLLVSEKYLSFFYFKLKRRELAGINTKAIDLLFRRYRGYIADESAMLPAVCQNVVEDYDSKLMCNYSHERVNICVIGRLEKPFILPAAKAIEKITMTHLEDKFTVWFIGASDNGNTEIELVSLFANHENVELIITGYLFPIPRKLLKGMDYCISSAGSAGVAYREGIVTISIDAHDSQAIGILGYTTQNTLYRKEEPRQNIEKLLNKVMYENELNKYEFVPSDYKPDINSLEKHIAFLEESEKSKEYFNINELHSVKDDIKKNIIRFLGIRNYFMLKTDIHTKRRKKNKRLVYVYVYVVYAYRIIL